MKSKPKQRRSTRTKPGHDRFFKNAHLLYIVSDESTNDLLDTLVRV